MELAFSVGAEDAESWKVDVLRKLELTDVFEVDQLYVGEAESHDPGEEGAEGDEDWDGSDD